MLAICVHNTCNIHTIENDRVAPRRTILKRSK